MEIEDFFTPLDWGVLIGYLLLTTWVGHLMRGKQASIKDFFLGGRKLPWLAVCGSIIATEISGVTFIGVPGMVMAAGGDFTYLQWAIGSVIGRILVGLLFVKVYYEDEIFSPYDYMGRRLGRSMKTLATVLFTVGSILAQSVRVLVAALPLKVVTGMPFEVCIVVIGVFAVIWTMMGGMQTVIWTDVMQFVLFTFGGLLTLFWISGHLDGGWSQVWGDAAAAGKTTFLNLDWGFQKDLEFTLWVALLAVPFQNLTVFGVDQLGAQRMFCCANAAAARKAIMWSGVGQLVTLMMLLVGAALFAFYQANPPAGAVAEFLQFDENTAPKGKYSGDAVFPTWIVTELPPGLSGLILAGVFAAAISSLDSILAALSQTTLSLFAHPERGGTEQRKGINLIAWSRILVVLWGIVLTVFTLGMDRVKDDIPILSLAFGMTAYTMGPMLAYMLAALTGKGRFRGLLVGTVLSVLLAVFVRTDLWVWFKGNEELMATLAKLPTYELDGPGMVKSIYTYVWLWPVTAALTYTCGLLFGGGKPGEKR